MLLLKWIEQGVSFIFLICFMLMRMCVYVCMCDFLAMVLNIMLKKMLSREFFSHKKRNWGKNVDSKVYVFE